MLALSEHFFQLGYRPRNHRNQSKRDDPWLDAPERFVGVDLKRGLVLGNLEYFLKRVDRIERVAFKRLRAGGDTFQTFRCESTRLPPSLFARSRPSPT